MNGGEDLITCPLCGTRYTEGEGRACRTECPLHRHCHLLSCPYCAHEVPAPTRLTRWLSRWLPRRKRPPVTWHEPDPAASHPLGEGDGD